MTLEQITSHYPHAGSLITFAQFLAISLHGLPKFVVFTPYPKLRPRRIPIFPYLLQVALFYAVSLLNNAAFAYRIPMAVHIIFRSGGLVVNMVMGWLLRGKRYVPIHITMSLYLGRSVWNHPHTFLAFFAKLRSNYRNESETADNGLL